MSDKLFDGRTAAAPTPSRGPASRRQMAQERAREVDEALSTLPDTEADEKLRKALGGGTALAPIRYVSSHEKGSPWRIEHARAGNDYFFQLIPQRTLGYTPEEVIMSMIAVMSGIFPESQHIYYTPPSNKYKMNVTFYTIKVAELAAVPGWEGAVERALKGLHGLRA